MEPRQMGQREEVCCDGEEGVGWDGGVEEDYGLGDIYISLGKTRRFPHRQSLAL